MLRIELLPRISHEIALRGIPQRTIDTSILVQVIGWYRQTTRWNALETMLLEIYVDIWHSNTTV